MQQFSSLIYCYFQVNVAEAEIVGVDTIFTSFMDRFGPRFESITSPTTKGYQVNCKSMGNCLLKLG